MFGRYRWGKLCLLMLIDKLTFGQGKASHRKSVKAHRQLLMWDPPNFLKFGFRIGKQLNMLGVLLRIVLLTQISRESTIALCNTFENNLFR